MVQKEIETVKDAEKKALGIISSANEKAQNIKKSAKATSETTMRQDLSKFSEQMKKKKEIAEKETLAEAQTFRDKGKAEAQRCKQEGGAHITNAVAKIVQGVIGE